MQFNSRIFNEIDYVRALNRYTINGGDATETSDHDIIERFVIIDNPKQPDESTADYNDRIAEEMMSFPMIGVIPGGSLLSQAINLWIEAGHPLNLHSLSSKAYYNVNDRYFLTSDANYDCADADLLGGIGDGTVKQKFLDFLNYK